MPQAVELDHGDSTISVELPDDARVVRYGETHVDPPEVDPVEATSQALERPLEMPPLQELAGRARNAVIAFPDRVKGGFHERAHRRVAIPLIVEALEGGGLERSNVRLLCAMGLHRKNTLDELHAYLGREIVDAFWPDRLLMHDAEDPEGLVQLGEDATGNVVEVNRHVAESDLPILVGHVQGNPYGGFSGGYKMCVTGLTGWPSIRCHHRPGTMHRDDFIPASVHSQMRRQFDSIGGTMEARMGKRFFAVDAVLGQRAQVLGVYAGAVDAVQEASWPPAERRTNVHLPDGEPFDVLVCGLPRSFHYGPGMGSNPILMLQAIAAQLTRCYGALRPDPVVIAASVCDGWFNEAYFGTYRRTFARLRDVADFGQIFQFEEELAGDPEGIYRYRFDHAYHPAHALSMVCMGAIAHQRARAVLIVGARAPGYARDMGCIPVPTFAEALRRAEGHVGRRPRILATPEAFRGLGVHLHLADGADHGPP